MAMSVCPSAWLTHLEAGVSKCPSLAGGAKEACWAGLDGLAAERVQWRLAGNSETTPQQAQLPSPHSRLALDRPEMTFTADP